MTTRTFNRRGRRRPAAASRPAANMPAAALRPIRPSPGIWRSPDSRRAQPTFQDTAIAPAPAPAAQTNRDEQTPIRSPRRAGTRGIEHHSRRPRLQLQSRFRRRRFKLAAPDAGGDPRRDRRRNWRRHSPADRRSARAPTCPATSSSATVNEAVTGSNGAVIPAGSTVVLEVASVAAGQNPDPAQIAFRVRSVVVNDKTYNVSGDVATVTPAGQDEGRRHGPERRQEESHRRRDRRRDPRSDDRPQHQGHGHRRGGGRGDGRGGGESRASGGKAVCPPGARCT